MSPKQGSRKKRRGKAKGRKPNRARPDIIRLPDDPEWEKAERAFARHAAKTLSPPEPD